jgi:predicted RNA-binding Zn ribbon-like protein
VSADPTASEPGGREPAPERLRLVQRFVNSNDCEGGHDEFSTPSALAGWFRNAGLRVGRLDARDLERVVNLREALRTLLLANNGRAVGERALAVLDHEAARTGVALRFSATTPALAPQGSGLDRVLGELLAVVFAAMVDGTWLRLKACRRDVCRWAFYDHSKNRSGTWCTMDVCGNRTKTSAYWRRTHPRRAAAVRQR